MMNILAKFKINYSTYLFIIICLMCGYIKNIIIIFSICLFHELGHIFFIKLFNYKIIKVELYPFGGYTLIDKKINSSINKDLIIASGGLIFQIILGLIVYNFKNNFNYITYHLIISYNLIFLLFNLLPIIPLDGNNILHLFLEKYFSYHLSYNLNLYISCIILSIFIFLNYYYNIDNYLIIIFLIFQLVLYYKDYKYYYKRFLLERYLDDFFYTKIENNTKDIKDLRKNVYHYFKSDNKYIREKEKIKEYLTKKRA